INSRNAFSTAVAAAFVEEFRKGKGRSAGEWTYQNENELPGVARSLVLDNPVAVLLAAAAPDAPKLAQNLRQAGLAAKVPFLFAGEEATGRGGTKLPVPIDADFAGELYAATPFFIGAKGTRPEEFANKYQ